MSASILSIGQTIKKLRKERNFTQEELAEQLNVTSQAVSKWENETGLPDISQIVPIASVFGVSTDVLFGTFGTNDDEEAIKIIEKAYLNIKNGDVKRCYAELQEGLKRYPNNIKLLVNCLAIGNALAYPENGCHDKARGHEIYQECIRMANLIILYSKVGGDILQAHMIMIYLHSAYGNIDKAREHAEKFPTRSDMTWNMMEAYISHFEKDHTHEAYHLTVDFHYRLTAIFDNMVLLGKSYGLMGKHDDALKIFFSVFSFMDVVFKYEKVIPPICNTDSGDVYVEIAKTYLEMNDIEKAVDWLEKMVDYDINIRSQFKDGMRVDTPLLRDVKYNFYYKFEFEEIKTRLLKKLNITEFDSLKNDERFITLLNRANSMNE